MVVTVYQWYFDEQILSFFRVDPSSEGRQNNFDRVASPENVFISFKTQRWKHKQEFPTQTPETQPCMWIWDHFDFQNTEFSSNCIKSCDLNIMQTFNP